MSESLTPFNHRPDPVLGAALREALQPRDPGGAVFRARVLAAAERQPVPVVDVLARWARLGIAAAVAAALLTGMLVGRVGRQAEPAVATTDPGAVVAGVQMPDASLLLAGYSER
ncbi:MAG TPA: hypothetical protein VIV10_00140 [Gemmatimonadales bacterium]